MRGKMTREKLTCMYARCAAADCKALAEYVIATGPDAVAGVCHLHQVEWRAAQIAAYEYAGEQWIKTHCSPPKEATR